MRNAIYAIFVQLVIDCVPHSLASLPRGLLKVLLLVVLFHFRVLVASHEHAPHETSVYCGGIQDNGVLLVVAIVGGDGNNGVDTSRQFLEPEVVHRPGGDQGLLGIVEDVCQSVHSHVEVGHVDTHSLLSHSTLVSVPGGLVVVREGDDGRANTKNHGRVNFAVGPSATVLP